MHVTDETRNSLFKYYPQTGADNTDTRVRHPCLDKSGYALNYPTNWMKKYARKIGTGKGAGCFTGITDVIRAIALISTEHLHTVWHYLLLFGHNVVPTIIQDLY
eukprot:10311091-Ditylum_brightwellii.AAC.1